MPGRRHVAARFRIGSGRIDVALAVAVGVATGLVLIAATSASAKVFVLLVGVLVVVAAWMLLARTPNLLLTMGWTALAATLSFSIKVHPVFRSDHLGGAIGIRLSITEFLLLALLVIGWIGGARLRGTTVRYPPLIATAAALYLACGAWSTLASNDIALGVFQLVATLQALIVGFVFCNVPRAGMVHRVLVTGLLLGLCAQGAVAAAQAWRPGLVSFPALGILADSQADSIDERLPEVDLGTTRVGGEIAIRPTGLLIHPNVLGAYLVLTLPLAVAVWLITPTRAQLALASVAIVLGGVALYTSLSRSAWLGTAVAAGAMALAMWRAGIPAVSRKRLATMALLAVVALVGLLSRADRIYLRLTETAGEAVDFRRDLVATAWRMAAAHPFAGVGLNTFVHEVEPFDRSGTSRIKTFPVHNVYMLELAETGMAGGLAFAGLVGATLWTLARGAARADDGPERLVAIALTCGLAGFWLAQGVDYIYRIPVLTTLVWAHAGLALGLANREAVR